MWLNNSRTSPRCFAAVQTSGVLWEEFVQDFKDVEFGKDLLDHAEPVNLPGFLFDDEVE